MRYRLRLFTEIAERWISLRRNGLRVGERILIVGDGEGCRIANWLLRRGMFRRAFSVVGLVSGADPTKHGMLVNGCRMLGGLGDLPAVIKQHDVGVILYTTAVIAVQARKMVTDFCAASKIKELLLDDLLALIGRELDQPGAARAYMPELRQRSESVSTHDILTGLPNRVLLQDRLTHSLAIAKRYKSQPAVMFIELREFDTLKATYGQKIGDELLKVTAQRLIKFKRESDTLARYQSHEFALILENVPDESAAETITKRISTLISEPIKINGDELLISADIGICSCTDTPDDGRTSANCDIGAFHSRKNMIALHGSKWIWRPAAEQRGKGSQRLFCD